MMKNNIKYLAILALGVIACEPEFDNPIEDSNDITSGEADFSTYVALGNSLTAGFADNALYISGQQNSYPNILSKQFAAAGGGEFTQPLMADNVGGFVGLTTVFPPRLVLAFDAEGNPGPALYTGQASTTDFSQNLGGSFNNMGVPGAKSYHLQAPGYGNPTGVAAGLANPYFARFASTPSATVLEDALAQNPTFFSLWIGNNDILSYATSGGVGVDHNESGITDPRQYASNDITNNNTFASIYNDMLDKLTANGAKGVVINIADVTSIPFFTTATIDALPLSEIQVTGLLQSQLPALHNGVLGIALQEGEISIEEYQSRLLEYVVGQNKILTNDEALTDLTGFMAMRLPGLGVDPQTTAIVASIFGQARQTREGDLVTLDAGSKLGIEVNPITGVPTEGTNFFTGINFPADNAVLEISEQEKITFALNFYNETIKTLATAKGLAFFDANAALKQIANGGISFNGGVVTDTFASGGGFSLDGVHPTPRGHAIIANSLMDAIETTYGAKLSKVEPGNYGTITLNNDVN